MFSGECGCSRCASWMESEFWVCAQCFGLRWHEILIRYPSWFGPFACVCVARVWRLRTRNRWTVDIDDIKRSLGSLMVWFGFRLHILVFNVSVSNASRIYGACCTWRENWQLWWPYNIHQKIAANLLINKHSKKKKSNFHENVCYWGNEWWKGSEIMWSDQKSCEQTENIVCLYFLPKPSHTMKRIDTRVHYGLRSSVISTRSMTDRIHQQNLPHCRSQPIDIINAENMGLAIGSSTSYQ